MAAHAKPLPVLGDDLSRAYWEAAREGRLLVQRCRACGEHQLYPRGHCVHCFAPDPEWVEAKGTGRLHTFSVVHRTATPGFADEVPYAVVQVKLAEGPKMISNLVGVKPHDIRIGMPVQVVFEDLSDEVTLPKFAPVV